MIPQKSKLPMDFFETFPECSLPGTVSKNTIKTGFTTQPLRGTWCKTCHALLGNSAHTYARAPLKLHILFELKSSRNAKTEVPRFKKRSITQV